MDGSRTLLLMARAPVRVTAPGASFLPKLTACGLRPSAAELAEQVLDGLGDGVGMAPGTEACPAPTMTRFSPRGTDPASAVIEASLALVLLA